VKISNDLERERERERGREGESKHCFLKKYVDNNNVLTSRLSQNVLLEETYVDEGYTNS
jgi:hypothetical protein